MDTKELRNYLQMVYDVESRIYELEQVKARLDKVREFCTAPEKRIDIIFADEDEIAVMMNSDEMEEAEEKEIQCFDELQKAKHRTKPKPTITQPLKISAKETKGVDIAMIILAVVGVAVLVLGIVAAFDEIVLAVLLWLFAAGVLGIALILFLAKRKAYGEYNKKLAAYTADQENYQAKMQAYDARIAEAQKQADEASAHLLSLRKQAMNHGLATADANMLNVKQALATLYMSRDRLYASDVLFPKYRNLPAVATMLEYLQAGRCTELEGPNGAYNLYEAEYRADLIVVKLDKIISQLERIQQAQYNLYHAVSKTNKLLQTMSGQMQDILRGQQKQLEIAAITASCTAAVAANTEAVKYLTLIN